MKGRLNKHQWMKLLIPSFLACSLFFGLYHMITVEGAESSPHFVMMRLEDIGPGGYYSSLDGLGKLRTVLEMLKQEHIPYSMAVIPRWINVSENGARYDRALNQQGQPYIDAFNQVLHQAMAGGGTIGMHGYTHQTGDVWREDGHQASGIGNEFDIAGEARTATPQFAEQRLQEGLRVLRQAGYMPHFWEAPHYHTAPAQDSVFQAYFGLIYQARVSVNPNPARAQYQNELNTGFGATTYGSVYVPTPLSYIPGNRDEKVILNQIGKTDRVNSFFYHPYLEFDQLQPVEDSDGRPLIRDGLPEFTYPKSLKSNLQKLIAQVRQKGYVFYSLHDYVPFTPAHRVNVANVRQASDVQIGDVRGRGQMDIVAWSRTLGEFTVTAGQFNGQRNEAQPAPQVWATMAKSDGAAFTLNDRNGDGKKGLWVVHPSGKLESYFSAGNRFIMNHRWAIPANRWLDLYELRQPDGDCVLAGQSQDRTQLLGVYLHKGVAKPIKPYVFKTAAVRELIVRELKGQNKQSLFMSKPDTSEGIQLDFDRNHLQWAAKKVTFNVPAELGEIRFGDFNGDGKEDILRWDEKNLTSRVYHQTDDHTYQLLSVFGPWGRKNSRLFIADFDGNGKKDIALMSNDDASLDIALSYQRNE
ncbi:DUF2334 domain-containing protein [Paenibacillus aestuarii]|uniref:DUF2334 domain-containing protein n=1 Tax=Paenibacillus aestuarii TaxID=516965 RepID=A0ABW0KJQ6_9BACL|nr:DUF2334 domain-containing protein [Paenibacillus aestuarii]